VFLAFGVHPLHEVFELGALIGRENGADFIPALLPDGFMLGIQGA